MDVSGQLGVSQEAAHALAFDSMALLQVDIDAGIRREEKATVVQPLLNAVFGFLDGMEDQRGTHGESLFGF